MKIRPTADNLIVKVNREDNKTTKSGIVLLSAPNGQERFRTAQVVAVGPGRYTSGGELIPVSVKQEDFIYFNKFAGVELEDPDGNLFLIIKEADIIGVQE